MPHRNAMETLHPSCIHLLHWSLQRSVNRTWTGSAFSSNESAWSVMVMGSQSRVWSGPELNASTSNLRLEKSGHEDLQSILNTMLQNEYIESFVYLLHQSSGWIPTITIPLKYMDSSTYINVTSFTHERKPSKGLLDSFPSPPQSHIEMWVDRWWNRSLGVPIFFFFLNWSLGT